MREKRARPSVPHNSMVLDSNILISYLNGDESIITALDTWSTEGRVLCISTITYAEVLSHPVLTEKEVRNVRDFLRRFVMLPFDDTVADTAAALRRQYKISLPDAGILATARTNYLPLVTRDKALFRVDTVSFEHL